MDENKSQNNLTPEYSGQELLLIAEQYLIDCHDGKPGKTGKSSALAGGARKREADAEEGSRFANVAGFCRYLGISNRKYSELCVMFPEETGQISAAFEDEALNSEMSPALLGAYLKARLGYAEAQSDKGGKAVAGQIKVVVSHDIHADGE